MPTNFHVVIAGDRGAEWTRVLNRNTFPVLYPPIMATLPDLGKQPVYLLDLDAMPAEQLRVIINYLSEKFHLDDASATHEIATAGIPILVDDTTLLIYFSPPAAPPPGRSRSRARPHHSKPRL